MTLPVQVTSEYSKKNLLEMKTVLHRKTARLCFILALSGMLMALVGLTVTVGFMVYLGVFWCILFLCMRNHAARKSARNTVKSNVKTFGSTVKTTLKFYNTMFTAHNETTGSDLRESYDEVRELLRTEHLIIILLADRVALMADVSTLPEEEAAELWNLLRENCRTAEVYEK